MKKTTDFLAIMIIAGAVFTVNGCKKEPGIPVLTTEPVTEITANTAVSGGNVVSDEGAEVTSRGVCFGTSANPVLAGPHTSDGTGPGGFVSLLSGLEAGKIYYVRAYAVSDNGTAYGNEVTFETPQAVLPELNTAEITEITHEAALSGGNISSDGGTPVTSRGICWSINPNPSFSDSKTSDRSGTGIFSSIITGLTHGTTYHVRAWATNSLGTSYGNELTFTTLQVFPVITTDDVFNVGQTEAVIRSSVDANGGSVILSRGVCWGTESGPSIDGWHNENGSGEGSFDSFLTGLLPGTDYFARAYATTETGTTYGNELAFKTADGLSPINFNPGIEYGSVTDVEGNVYKTVIIGDQTWMAENLKTTKYNDGGPIPFVDNPQDWTALSTPAHAWYADSPAVYKDICGAMYNWYTISTGKLCPTGWHVPAYSEYTDLIDFLDGATNTGGKMKEAGTSHWEVPNAGATNESGWTGLPSGRINEIGSTMSYGWAGYWWTSTETDPDRANNIMLYYDFVFVDDNNYDKRNGMAVRCVKD